ncbi:MAG: hypothetical protein ACIARQ_17285 [Phycisphaerales bacterium JB061]
MRTKTSFMLTCLTAATLAVVGCEESTSTSSNASPESGRSPQSQLGKSVEMGKNLQDQIQGRDMAAGALADSISGGDGAVQVGNISIPIPAGWTKVTPSNSMRLAQYEAEDGEVVIAFSQAGGSIDDNIDRWANQVTQNNEPVTPDVEELTVAGYPAVIVELIGRYAEGGMMGTPTYHNDYQVKAAIIDTGATKTFIKMTGPISLVDDHAAHFDNMVRGIARK